MTLTGQEPIRLRYPATCSRCGADLPPGSTAYWDRSLRSATCLPCDLAAPADPWATVDEEARGTAGGSARAEYERRSRRGSNGAASWKKGAVGEETLAGRLDRAAVAGRFSVLHDRSIPGSRANIDHIVVARTGIWVIDAKRYTGKIEHRVSGMGRRRTEQLVVRGRDRTGLALAMRRQVEVVDAALAANREPPVEIVPVLCFIDGEWDPFAPPFEIAGVRIVWPRRLAKMLGAEGPVDDGTRSRLVRLLGFALPPAA